VARQPVGPGQSRRIAFGFRGFESLPASTPTPWKFVTGTGQPNAESANDSEASWIGSDRSNSPFGDGWWLAGIEQLFWACGWSQLVVLGMGARGVYAPVGR